MPSREDFAKLRVRAENAEAEVEWLRGELDAARNILSIVTRERDALASGSSLRAQVPLERPPDLWLGDPRPGLVRLADLDLRDHHGQAGS